ncbi:hypothetical protein VNI00_018362 [Paramarasmius palmivorus]|uniref:JmjC domain-containing protein n=1 Tax=Paramarasmius palmivorus TaxID=297713 RepID=A0AAW0AWU9_9AGAR
MGSRQAFLPIGPSTETPQTVIKLPQEWQDIARFPWYSNTLTKTSLTEIQEDLPEEFKFHITALVNWPAILTACRTAQAQEKSQPPSNPTQINEDQGLTPITRRLTVIKRHQTRLSYAQVLQNLDHVALYLMVLKHVNIQHLVLSQNSLHIQAPDYPSPTDNADEILKGLSVEDRQVVKNHVCKNTPYWRNPLYFSLAITPLILLLGIKFHQPLRYHMTAAWLTLGNAQSNEFTRLEQLLWEELLLMVNADKSAKDALVSFLLNSQSVNPTTNLWSPPTPHQPVDDSLLCDFLGVDQLPDPPAATPKEQELYDTILELPERTTTAEQQQRLAEAVTKAKEAHIAALDTPLAADFLRRTTPSETLQTQLPTNNPVSKSIFILPPKLIPAIKYFHSTPYTVYTSATPPVKAQGRFRSIISNIQQEVTELFNKVADYDTLNSHHNANHPSTYALGVHRIPCHQYLSTVTSLKHHVFQEKIFHILAYPSLHTQSTEDQSPKCCCPLAIQHNNSTSECAYGSRIFFILVPTNATDTRTPGHRSYMTDLARDGTNVFGWVLSHVVLNPGDSLLLPPLTPYYEVVLETSLTHTDHFIATATICQSCWSIIHALYHQEDYDSVSLYSTRVALAEILLYWKNIICDTNHLDTTSKCVTSYHIPHPYTMTGILDILSLINIIEMGSTLWLDTYCGVTHAPELISLYVRAKDAGEALVAWIANNCTITLQKPTDGSGNQEVMTPDGQVIIADINDIRQSYIIQQAMTLIRQASDEVPEHSITLSPHHREVETMLCKNLHAPHLTVLHHLKEFAQSQSNNVFYTTRDSLFPEAKKGTCLAL